MISFYSEKLLICVMGGSIMIVKNILLFIITIIALAPISAAGAWEKVNVGGGSMKHVLTDVDGDGHVDSIAVDKWRKNPDKCTGNWATILTGWAKEQWNGSYQVGHASIVSYVNSQRVGDINGDGLPDMVIGTYGSNASKNVPANMRDTIYAAINPGNAGEWFFYHIGNLPTTTNGCEVVDIGDLNKDGYPDILAGGESNELRVYVNPGTMSNDWTYHTLYSNVSGLHIKGIALADFNNDTYTDIVISVSSSDAASGKLLVLLNPHVITDPWTLVEVDTSCWSCMETVTTEDIDGDGNKDIVFANRQHGRATDLSWYRNTGTGWTRNNVASLSTAQLNGFMSASVDLDQDNQLDILCYSIDGGGTFWYKNPSWTATLITSDVINNYAVGDIDNDGDKDIICNGFWYKNPAITPQIGWWKLDNTTGTLAYDSTKAGNDASIFNGIWVDGKIDNGLQFNGASTYAAVKNMVYNKIGQIDQLTVMAWIKTTGSGSAILDWDGSEYWSLGVNLDGSIDTGRVTWITCGATAGVNCLGSIKRVDDGKWHHIAVTYNSLLGKKDIYIDGALDNSAIVYTVGERLGTGVTRYGFIGDGSEANIYNGSRLLKYFNGVIDEPRIIRKVLSPAEIQNQHSRISGCWKFDETNGGVLQDSSGNANYGVATNMDLGIIHVGGKEGNALAFDGVDDYVDCGNDAALSIAKAITVEMWFYPQAWVSGYASHPINKWTSTSDANYVMYFFGDQAGVNNKKICFYATAGGTWQRVSPYYLLPALDTWYHIVWTYADDSGGRLYVNGALQPGFVSSCGQLAVNDANLKIGEAGLNCIIDEAKIHSIVLHQEEINIITSQIKGGWYLNEGSGGYAADISSNNNQGTLTYMDLGTCWVDGKYGKALSFDGINDYVNCGNASSLSLTDAITVEAWFRPHAWPAVASVHPISKWTKWQISDANYVMYFYGPGSAYQKICFYGNAGGTWRALSPAYLIPALDAWYHIAWTYSATAGGKLYINGVLQAGSTSGYGALATNAADFKIGDVFNGAIDEVKIYSRALSKEEINIDMGNLFKYLYMYTLTDTTSQIKGGWYLNEGSGGYAADISSNNNQGTLTYMDLGTCWVDGKYGKALSFDGINDYVNCGNASSLSLTDAITVEAWFRPHAWPAVASVHPISKWTKWQISDANYVMYFYGPGSAYQKICFYGNAGGTWRALSPAYLIPALDAWYHIAWTYSATAGGKLYINGVLQAGSTSGYGALATNAADFKIGDVFNGAIDEVVIYSTVLDEAEINKDMGAPPATNVLMLGLQQLELSRDEELYTLRCRILDSGNNIIKEVTFQNNKYLYEDALNISDLPAGTYTIEMAFLEPAGQPIQIVSEAYTNYGFQAPAWQGNQIGISTTVPGPWVSMEVIDNSIRCWGRGYAFNNSILPCQITSQNKQMLYAPMQLLGREGGIDTTVSGVSMTWQEQTVRKINCLTQGVLGSFNVSANIAVEYDGFMWVDLHLNAASATTIEKLILEIPMKTEYATLINSGNYNLSGTGALSPSGWNKNLKEKPIFWVGNEDVGMQWFAENLVGWHLTDPTYSVKVIPPNGGEVKVQLNLIDAPISIVGLRTISFGLQFTPVKPKVSGWRNMRLGWEYGSVPMNYNLNPYFILFKYYNYPDANQLIDGNLDRRTSLENLGKTVCTYLALQAASPLTAEWRYYGNEWRQTPSSDIPTAYADGSSAWLTSFVCPNANDYREFYLWKLGGPLQANELYGLYFDWGQARLCNNTSHGCGWYDESSTLCSSYNILGARKLAERIYTAAKEHDPSAIIVSHMSGEVAMPVHGFADIMVDGENLIASVAQDESYYNLMPLDKFRAELTHNWGSVPAFLCEFVNASRLFRPDRVSFWDTPEALKPKRHLMGLIMVHDTQCWPIYGLETEYNNLWTIQDDFGWNDTVEFLPYWNNSQYISITPSDCNIVVSIYKKTGKFMLVPFNNTDAAINATLTVNMNLLGFPPGTITLRDKLTNETFSLIDGVISLPIDDRAFRILVNE
jgi:hypothetical protein